MKLFNTQLTTDKFAGTVSGGGGGGGGGGIAAAAAGPSASSSGDRKRGMSRAGLTP